MGLIEKFDRPRFQELRIKNMKEISFQKNFVQKVQVNVAKIGCVACGD